MIADDGDGLCELDERILAETRKREREESMGGVIGSARTGNGFARWIESQTAEPPPQTNVPTYSEPSIDGAWFIFPESDQGQVGQIVGRIGHGDTSAWLVRWDLTEYRVFCLADLVKARLFKTEEDLQKCLTGAD